MIAKARPVSLPRPKAADITLFTQELSFMLGAGVPLSRALDVLASDAPSARLRAVVEGLRKGVRAGRQLSEVMAEQSRAFPDSYVRMVRIAEASGTLAPVLQRIHKDRSRMHGIRRKITSALSYPAFLCFVAVGALTFISYTVIPQIKALTVVAGGAQAGAAANGQAIDRLVRMSDWMNAHAGVLGIGILLAIAAITIALLQRSVRERVLDALISLPGFGSLISTAMLAQLTRNLAMLLSAGITLPDALRLVKPVLASGRIRLAVSGMEQALRRGEDFSKPLTESGLAPAMLTSLLRVGNETGRLDVSLSHAAEIFEEKLEIAIERSLTLLEPAIIVVISGVIGTVIYTIVGALVAVNDLAV